MQGATSNVNMKRIICDGNDVLDLHRGSEEAMQYARKVGRPVLLLVEKLNRRFGHGECRWAESGRRVGEEWGKTFYRVVCYGV